MFKPRFSLRVLLAAVTLVGLYFGSWELTKKWGLADRRFDSSPAPFVVVSAWRYGAFIPLDVKREYHVWLFGATWNVYERNWREDELRQLPFY